VLSRFSIDRARRRRVREAERRLWQELCAAHGLRFSERRLLKRAAAEMGLTAPAILFFRPSFLASYLKDRSLNVSPERKAAVKRLARVLFSDSQPFCLGGRGPLGDDGLPRRFAPDEIGEPESAESGDD